MAIELWPLLAYAINYPSYSHMLVLVGPINYPKKQKTLVVHNSLKVVIVLHHGIDTRYDGSFLSQNDVFILGYTFIQMHMVINISLDY
jgi:hypothetical protein